MDILTALQEIPDAQVVVKTKPDIIHLYGNDLDPPERKNNLASYFGAKTQPDQDIANKVDADIELIVDMGTIFERLDLDSGGCNGGDNSDGGDSENNGRAGHEPDVSLTKYLPSILTIILGIVLVLVIAILIIVFSGYIKSMNILSNCIDLDTCKNTIDVVNDIKNSAVNSISGIMDLAIGVLIGFFLKIFEGPRRNH